MFFSAPLFTALAFSGLVSALPRPQDSAVGPEVAVSAPDGIPITNTVELASQSASEASTSAQAQATNAGSNYGSNSGYGSSSGYGSNSGYGSGNAYGGSSDASVTSSAASSYATPSYGSGSQNWGSSYDDCVSQCLASFGSPASSYTPPSTTENSSGSSGSGATHTVIVAPTQGVLRYIPFAVNASVGDTIKFMWGANNHTVTKSSALTPCNKSGDALFASGTHDKDFSFTQLVNDTNPTYFYCATPGHCQKGMFGIINPPSAFGQPTSFSSMIQPMGAQNPDMAAYTSYTSQQTANNTAASKWGGNINLAALPDWAQSIAAENVLYTRNFLAQNAEVLKDDGSVDLSSATSTPLMIPQDVGAALSNAAAAPSSPSPAASSAPASSAAPSAAANAQSSNGAGSLASPKALVAFVAVLATFFAL